MIKNTAGQKIGAQLVSTTDGSAFTGAVTVYVCGDAGTQAAGSVGSGACTHEGNGYHTYAPAQAETNYDLVAFTFTGSGAVPVTVQVYTIAGAVAQEASVQAVSAQVAGIGSGTGSALNFSADSDNASAPLKGVTKVGTQTNTYANTYNDNNVYHIITHATNNIDWVYGFSVGAGRNATKAVFLGYLAATNPATGKTISVNAYDWEGTAWEEVKIITGQAGITDATIDITLYPRHTGTGADAGKVYLRFTATSQAGAVLNIDQLYLTAQNLGQTVGYSQGAIWIDTVGGTAGTTPYVHGTADKPVLTWANALTLATAIGINRFQIAPGSLITATANCKRYAFGGRGYRLALAGYDFSYATIEGCEDVSGVGTSADWEMFFWNCQIAACTLGEFDMHNCHIVDTITLGANSKPYLLNGCVGVPIGTSGVDFASTSNNVVVVGNARGVWTIAGMSAGDTLYFDGNAALTLAASCTGGTVYISGAVRLTNSGSGQTIYDTARWDEGQNVTNVTGSVTGAVTFTAADIRTAVGLASANLDTQLGDLPTNAELTSALAAADDAVLAAISALNNLSSAGAQSAAAAALTAYAAAKTSDLAAGVNVTEIAGITLGGSGTTEDPWGPV